MPSFMEHLKQVMQGTPKRAISDGEISSIKKAVERWSGRLMGTAVHYGFTAQELYTQGIADGMEVARRWDREEVETVDVLAEVDKIVRGDRDGE